MWANEQADEARFFLATLESFQTGRVTPLLKEELRCKIQSRRLSEGKNELSVNLEEEDVDIKDCSLRPDEIERNRRRKEQNRKAAAKFRKKQKSQNKALQGLVLELEKRNAELKKEVAELTRERDELRVEVLDTLRKKSSHECGANELSFQQFVNKEFEDKMGKGENADPRKGPSVAQWLIPDENRVVPDSIGPSSSKLPANCTEYPIVH